MTVKSRSLGRLPADIRARERLREAQAAEARATSAVYNAEAALDAALVKRNDAIAVATIPVDVAESALAATRADLITVSGLDRAAALLGVNKAELRKAAKTEQPKPELGHSATRASA